MKKDFIKIKYIGNSYSCVEYSGEEFVNLGLFLTSDAGCYSPSFKKWAESADQSSYGGNFSTLEKEDGYILISEEMSEEPDGGPFFKISIEEFVKVLDQWEHFCKTKPKEILITRENGVIKMEGKN